MTFLSRIRRAIASFNAPIVAPSATLPAEKRPVRVSYEALARFAPQGEDANPFSLPVLPPGVKPAKSQMAMDSSSNIGDLFAYATVNSAYAEGQMFLGYPYLAELTQRVEYRRPAEIMAKEMTRKWIKLQCSGEEDKTDKLKELDIEMKRLGVQEAFRTAAEQDGFFGRSQIFLDFGDGDDREELKTPLVDSVLKIRKGSLKSLRVIEPLWTFPNEYNSNDPLDPTFFKPQQWFVVGKQIHNSRLLSFVGRKVPDLLKPAYSFGGLSLSQIAKPYVDNWLRTRQSVSDLLHSFSVSGLKTDLSGILNGGGGEEILNRIDLFNKMRDNRGAMVLNKDTEEWFNISTPLGTLDKLQAQAQEQMAAAYHIPLVILLGITPTGLNASGEEEVRTFYDWIEAEQQALFTENLSRLINIIQLSLWGEIDPEVGFVYNPLWSLNALDMATVRKTECETDVGLINAGIIDNMEARKRIASQAESQYASLDLGKEITPPSDEPGMEDLDDNLRPPGGKGVVPTGERNGGFSQSGGMNASALFKDEK